MVLILLTFLNLSVTQMRRQRDRHFFHAAVFISINHFEARQQVQQSDEAQPRDVIHERGVCVGGGQSASSFVVCLGCFGAAA